MARHTRRRRRVTRNKGRRRRRMRRNQVFGVDIMSGIVVPVLYGLGGFVTARYAGNMLAERGVLSGDPRMAKGLAALATIPLAFWLGKKVPLVGRNLGPIVLGLGLAPAEAYLRDTPLLGGSRAAAQVTAPLPGETSAPAVMETPPPEQIVAASGMGVYQALANNFYTEGMLGLGTDPANQANIDGAMDVMEVSTVTPTDMALPASSMPQVATVREGFVNQGDRGYAGGVFARTLFSGMMGS